MSKIFYNSGRYCPSAFLANGLADSLSSLWPLTDRRNRIECSLLLTTILYTRFFGKYPMIALAGYCSSSEAGGLGQLQEASFLPDLAIILRQLVLEKCFFLRQRE